MSGKHGSGKKEDQGVVMEYKTTSAEFKAPGDAGEYDGHFSIFDNVDDGDDVIHRGAFLKTIQERKSRIKVFFAHDWMKLIAPPPSVLEEDAIGLHAAGHLTLESFWGKEAWALMKDGALTEGSIGYRPVKWDYDDPGQSDNGGVVIRHLRELKLYEISPVPLGMNPLTNVEAIKALKRANGGSETLEVFAALVNELTETDITAENADDWKEIAGEISDRLTEFAKHQTAAEPQRHSALLERKLRLRAAQHALSQRN